MDTGIIYIFVEKKELTNNKMSVSSVERKEQDGKYSECFVVRKVMIWRE